MTTTLAHTPPGFSILGHTGPEVEPQVGMIVALARWMLPGDTLVPAEITRVRANRIDMRYCTDARPKGFAEPWGKANPWMLPRAFTDGSYVILAPLVDSPT